MMSESPLPLLLVVHDAEDRYQIRSALARESYIKWIVHEVITGREGLEYCLANNQPQPHIVLIDLTLPDMKAQDFLHALKGDNKLMPLPVVILTASMEIEAIRATIAAGAQDFIQKSEISPFLLTHILLTTIERYQLIHKLATSEANLRVLADSIPMMVWVSGADQHCTFFNKRWLEFTGRVLEQELGFGWLEGVHPDDESQYKAIFEQAVNTHQEFEVDYRLRRHDGAYRWVLDRGIPRFGPQNEFLGFTGGCIDITDRKEMEQALIRNESHNRALMAAIPDNVLRMDYAGTYLDAHLSGDPPFPFTAAEILGRQVADIMPLEIAQRILAAQRRVIDTGKIETVEYARPIKDAIYYLESHIALSGENEVVAIVRNVTERRKAEETIRYQAGLLENVMDAIVSTDLQLNIRSWNRAAESLYGISAIEAIGEPFFELVHIDHSPSEIEQALLKLYSDGHWHGEMVQLRRDHVAMHILASLTFILDGNGQRIGIVVVNRDITERKRAEQLLLRIQKHESINLLASGIAHDFNNLLTGILGQASLATRKLPADHPALNNLKKAIRSTERAADLTRQLLAYTGQGAFQIEAIDLNRLVLDNIGLFETILPTGAKLEILLGDHLSSIEIDRGQAQQVLMNLVINAAEAIPTDTGKIIIQTGKTEITTGQNGMAWGIDEPAPGRYIHLKVTDNGIGMSDETLARIFDPYFTTKTSGSGLGLAATLGIVQRCKGAIQVKSKVGAGATFSILFPAVNMPTTRPPTLIAGKMETNGTILVVDDETPIRETVSDILTLEGLHVLQAANGQEGLNQFKANRDKIDLILLDMKMPVMDGEQTYHALRTLNPTVKILLSSGYHDADATRHLTRQRFTGFLNKPYSLDMLITTIQGMLQQES